MKRYTVTTILHIDAPDSTGEIFLLRQLTKRQGEILYFYDNVGREYKVYLGDVSITRKVEIHTQ